MRAILLMVACSQGEPPISAPPALQVDDQEVLRRGNVVQTVGDGHRDGEVDRFTEALAPPPSDADKWFISVLATRGAAACEQLKGDWTKDPWLLALANPVDPKQSWAHYNVYLREDRSQSFRLESLHITGYPTVIVQPPRSGKYGDPKTVVFQGSYSGDGKKLAQSIVGAIRQYVTTLTPAVLSEHVSQQTRSMQRYDSPWQPPPNELPMAYVGPSSASTVDQLFQVIPPRPDRQPLGWTVILSLLIAVVSLSTATAIGMICVNRARRQSTVQPPLMTSAKLDQVLNQLKALAKPGKTRRKQKP